jgi:S-layer protein
VNISLVDSGTSKQVNTLTLFDAALKTVVITGNTGLTLTNTDTTVTSVDASAVTNTAGTVAAGATPLVTGFFWATGALAAASTIRAVSRRVSVSAVADVVFAFG